MIDPDLAQGLRSPVCRRRRDSLRLRHPTPSVTPAVDETVTLFLTGTAGEITSISAVPLLFDSEVLQRESDIRLLYATLIDSGGRFRIASINGLPSPADAADRFGSDFEARAILDRYADIDTVMVTLNTDFGTMHLLLGERIAEYRRILGVSVE